MDRHRLLTRIAGIGQLVLLGLFMAWVAWEGPLPLIKVRWSPNLAAEARERAERELDLQLVGSTDADTYQYQLWSAHRSSIVAVVRYPGVADTSGIDRERFRLDPQTVGVAPGRVWRGGLFRGRQGSLLFRVVFGVILGVTFASGLLARRTRPTRP
jgi:hypothetical protein